VVAGLAVVDREADQVALARAVVEVLVHRTEDLVAATTTGVLSGPNRCCGITLATVIKCDD
jgi:hypothetical protein